MIRWKKIPRKILFLDVILIIIGVVSSIVCKNSDILTLLAFAISFYGMKFDVFIKKDLWIRTIIFLLIIALCSLGLTEDVILYRSNGLIRHSFGFLHPNTFAIWLAGIVIDIFYLSSKKCKTKDSYNAWKYIFGVLSCVFMYFYCDARGAEICLIVLMIGYLALQKENIRRICGLFLVALPWILLILSIVATIYFGQGSKIALAINDLTSGRLAYANAFLRYYGVNFFGHNLELLGQWESNSSLLTILDNAYIRLLVQYGIVCTFLVLFMYSAMIKYSLHDNNSKNISAIFVAILFMGLVEHHIFIIAVYPVILYIVRIIEDKNIILCNEKKYE